MIRELREEVARLQSMVPAGAVAEAPARRPSGALMDQWIYACVREGLTVCV